MVTEDNYLKLDLQGSRPSSPDYLKIKSPDNVIKTIENDIMKQMDFDGIGKALKLANNHSDVRQS